MTGVGEIVSYLYDFLIQITPDGWMNFFRSFSLTILIITIIKTTRQKTEVKNKNIYYNLLLGSLPSIDVICTQSDYLDDEDGLLGSLTNADTRSKILEDRMNDQIRSDIERENYKYKVKKHKAYIDYWTKTNEKIEDLMTNEDFKDIENKCDGNVFAYYCEFVAAFRNEHFFGRPIIRTELLRNLLMNLAEEIRMVEK
ncbi:hypothetical protein SAMN05216349_1462 [Oribacterium sp. KHPX15]|uniref:hypothetical protein n=1 Tax=Oribacterium sp. KHPX15 TaxID=1855342 RepID=UPI00089931D4|nr:hypothetical protein [Oribacterium sp. KHPX15]SEA89261.1 hypothetical protein SAMN05216349_1462 [Oribacterium sp. KHPX15]